MVTVPLTYPEALAGAEAAEGERVLLRSDPGGAVSVASLAERSRWVATGLLARGLRRGGRIAVAGADVDPVGWLAVFLGAARIGVAVVLPVPRGERGEREHELRMEPTPSGRMDLIARELELGPEDPAMVADGEPLTHGGLIRSASARAEHLGVHREDALRVGVGPDDVAEFTELVTVALLTRSTVVLHTG